MSETLAGTLYLVPTPIGNLDDITLRALNVLRTVRLVLAEDTRTAKHLLDHFAITTNLRSYTEHNHKARVDSILSALAEGDVALVSEAGMPGINDPGQALVAAVVEAGYGVAGLPGASAVPLAVAVSGFPVRSFSFVGFLPHGAGARRRLLRESGAAGHALVAFETPHRLRAALADVTTTLGDRRIAVCRELTKVHEEVFRGSAAEALVHFETPRGEVTLVIEAAPTRPTLVEAGELDAFLQAQVAGGASARDAVAAAAARFGVPRRRAYAAWQALQGIAEDR